VDREGAWRKLLASGLLKRDRVPGGIRLSAAPGAAEGDGEVVLAGMFASL